jgi:predicted nucleotidyltransferase
MKERVLEALAHIEREHEVRVLLAVESGSRAWGFASPDSDYDVRFIYAHALDWYLSVLEQRDVIERMLPGDLDVSGWELRKALRLFSKCNLALNEWLGSPIVYQEVTGFRQQLTALVPDYFNARSGMHHYRSMAERAFTESYLDGRVRIKKIFYVLRALLACRWIERSASQPPTEFAKLVAAPWVTADERTWIEELLVRKAKAAEADSVDLDAGRADGIRAELQRYEAGIQTLVAPQKVGTEPLDAVLRNWIAAA